MYMHVKIIQLYLNYITECAATAVLQTLTISLIKSSTRAYYNAKDPRVRTCTCKNNSALLVHILYLYI